ncbi:unnamed protein product [Schistocephalus solidus]|uniref:NOL1/NOP2/Sun domain family member 4 n=1 Tax=Schistocephalus solidus TaxID=70667 RepID=A0A183SZ75_SCHSO|nr:unnamed protein product [Schistocephalus solidus]
MRRVGLGERGNLVKVHRNRFWNHLYLLRLAELPTDERITQLNAEEHEGKSVLCGHAYEVQQRLLNMTLYIPMNPNAQWVLTPNHVKGIMLDEKNITLPEAPVTPETLGMFHVHVNIDDLAMVPVESRIFLYQRLDAKTCTRPPANVFRKIRLIDWVTDFRDDELRLLPGQSLNARLCFSISDYRCLKASILTSFQKLNPCVRLSLVDFVRASSNQAKARLSTSFAIQRFQQLSPSNLTALRHFDRYYAHVYGLTAWSALRAALLTPCAKVAVLNSICPEAETAARRLLSPAHGCLDLISSLIAASSSASTATPPQAVTTETTPDDDNNSEGQRQQHQFLVESSLPSDEALSEFVSPTEFVSEHSLYVRDSDRAYTLRGASTDAHTESLLAISEAAEMASSAFWRSCKHLRCFYLPSGIYDTVGRPALGSGKSFDFYPMDLGSVLAVLALDIQPGVKMLDFCSAPGGKAITALQTLNLSHITCMDVSESRLDRLIRVLENFGPGIGIGRPGMPDVRVVPTSSLRPLLRKAAKCAAASEELFDRVLVDVPCSTDRMALTSDKGSVFSRGKVKTRMELPTVQKKLLWYLAVLFFASDHPLSIAAPEAMLACRPGGYVVYSTCTLSPAQNQSVVEACLTRLARTKADGGHLSNLRYAFVDPTPFIRLVAACEPLGVNIVPAYASLPIDTHLFPADFDLPFPPPMGFYVLPRLSSNYGPSFVCKLKRLE